MSTWEVFWNQINLKDFIDILVVAFLIYQGLLIIHGTRAVQMLVGIGILMALFWLGHSFKFYSLNWVLNHFFESFFIIAIILFQDQFRSALANFGTRKKLFTFFKEKGTSYFEIDEIVEAVVQMSQEKIGALIVMERSQGLGNYKDTGTLLGARVHSDLIYTIFQSAGPLHDGAIILSEDKIVSAGCFLPLARNLEVDRRLGTRHRAALGITEDTDCVAVTVSEETGKINIAVAGILYSCRSSQELRQALRDLLRKEGVESPLKMSLLGKTPGKIEEIRD